MITISLCMIVKNEEETLARCLDSVKGVAEEIVVVDTGSTDNTRDIAARYGAVYDFAWTDDFAAARNFAFSKATKEYVLWLDADDVLLDSDRQSFLQLKRQLDPKTDLVMMKYNVAFDGDGRPTFSYYRERLVKNRAGFVWEGEVHEAITPHGNILYADIAVTHQKMRASDPDRNLRIYEGLRKQGKSLGPRQQFYYARELFDHGRYEEAARQLTAFLDGGQGWLENNISACQLLHDCLARRGDGQGALRALLRALTYDAPRPETCCGIGSYFLRNGQPRVAAYWFEQALSAKVDPASGAFIQPDYAGYIPYLQLCVCYDQLGQRDLAAHYNELAAGVRPQDPSVAHNRAYFAALARRGENKAPL